MAKIRNGASYAIILDLCVVLHMQDDDQATELKRAITMYESYAESPWIHSLPILWFDLMQTSNG